MELEQQNATLNSAPRAARCSFRILDLNLSLCESTTTVISFLVWTALLCALALFQAVLPWRGLREALPGLGLCTVFAGACLGVTVLRWNKQGRRHIWHLLSAAVPEAELSRLQALTAWLMVGFWLAGGLYSAAMLSLLLASALCSETSMAGFCSLEDFSSIVPFHDKYIFNLLSPIGVGIAFPIGGACCVSFGLTAITHYYQILLVVERHRGRTQRVDEGDLLRKIVEARQDVAKSAQAWWMLIDPTVLVALAAFGVCAVRLYEVKEVDAFSFESLIAILSIAVLAILFFFLTLVNQAIAEVEHFVDDRSDLFGDLKDRNALIEFLHRKAIQWRVLGIALTRQFVKKSIGGFLGSLVVGMIKSHLK